MQTTRRAFLETVAKQLSLPLCGLSVPALSDERRPQAKHPTAVSNAGVELIKEFEGLRLEAYRCPAGVWTIGYGHTKGVQEGSRLQDAAAARQLLANDLKPFCDEVSSVFRGIELTQTQFDALVSARFNVDCLKGGTSGFAQRLLRDLPKLNARSDSRAHAANAPTDMEIEIVAHLCQYNKANQKFLPGLLRRRLSEGLLFIGYKDYVVTDLQFKDYMRRAKTEIQRSSQTQEREAPDKKCIDAIVRMALTDRSRE